MAGGFTAVRRGVFAENGADLVRRDDRAVIMNINADAVLLFVQGNRNRFFGVPMFSRVAQKIGEHLLQSYAIPLPIDLCIAGEFDLSLGINMFGLGNGILDRRVQIDFFDLNPLVRANFQSRQFKQVIGDIKRKG